MTTQSNVIAGLVADLVPVKPERPARALAGAAFATLAMALLVAILIGWRADLLMGRPSPMFLLRCGMLLLLGGITAQAVIAMASPAVGRSRWDWQGAALAALLFPLAGGILTLTGNGADVTALWRSGVECLTFSLFAGLMIAVPIIASLRRGAPVQLVQAGWLTGLAAGALGAFSYNLACPHDNIAYIGLSYALAIGSAAILGRLTVTYLIRW